MIIRMYACRRLFCTLPTVKNEVAEYLNALHNMNHERVSIEARILGIKQPSRSKKAIISQIESDADTLQDEILLRLEFLNQEPSLLNMQKKTAIEKLIVEDNKDKSTERHAVTYDYLKPEGENCLTRKNRLSDFRKYSLDKYYGIYSELFTDHFRVIFPEEYNKEMLYVYLHGHSLREIRRQLRIFKQRCILATINKHFLRCISLIKKSTVDIKEIAYQLFTIQREYRSFYKLPNSIPSKITQASINNYITSMLRARGQASSMMGYYTTFTLFRMLSFVIQKPVKSDIESVGEIAIFFTLVNNRYKDNKHEGIKSSLSVLFSQVCNDLIKIRQPSEDEELFLWSEVISELTLSVEGNPQRLQMLDRIINNFSQNIAILKQRPKFLRMLSTLKVTKLAINCMCILYNKRVHQNLCNFLVEQLTAHGLAHLPQQYFMRIVLFLYTNKVVLGEKEMNMLALHSAMCHSDLRGNWTCFLLLSRSGPASLPHLLRLAISIADQTSRLQPQNQAERSLYMSILSKADRTIKELSVNSPKLDS